MASLALYAYSVARHANTLDLALGCQPGAHAFIEQLSSTRLIDVTPMRIDENSVNALRPMQGTTLMAFGFRMFAVFSYEQDQPMFKQGRGAPVKHSTYAVVVI